jgi:hypothetical protein
MLACSAVRRLGNLTPRPVSRLARACLVRESADHVAQRAELGSDLVATARQAADLVGQAGHLALVLCMAFAGDRLGLGPGRLEELLGLAAGAAHDRLGLDLGLLAVTGGLLSRDSGTVLGCRGA